jgi:predicted nucleotidyltransferase
MHIFDPYTLKLLKALNLAKVKFLVVGGYAVNFHGFRRTTGDIDLWINPDNANKEKIIEALRSIEIEESTLEELQKLDFTRHLIFSDGQDPFRIDFITIISGVEFEEAWKERIITTLDGISIAFIHLNHLILSKVATGRTKDKMDVEQLQKLQKLKKKN